MDPQHIDELVEIRFQATRAVRIAFDQHRHARDARLLGVTDGQRLDVEGPPTKQGGDAVQDAGLVLDVNNECVFHLSILRVGGPRHPRSGWPRGSSLGCPGGAWSSVYTVA